VTAKAKLTGYVFAVMVVLLAVFMTVNMLAEGR